MAEDPSKNPPQIDFTGRDFPTITAELEEYVRKTRPDLWSDFFRANLGETLIEMNALVGDMISYSLDAISSEVFVSTARREESALRFARSVGYKPRRPTAASVTVDALSLPEEVTQNGGVIEAGVSLPGPEGVSYELTENVEIPQGQTAHQITLREGESHEETFEASGQPGQTIELSEPNVENDSWKVYVGPVIPENLWTEVFSIAAGADDGTQTIYEVSFTSEGRLRITFGGGNTGPTADTSIAPDQTITVRYRSTAGEQGNAPISSIRGAVNIQVGAQLAADGTIVAGSGTGTVVAVTYENIQSVATGGSDRESLEEMRVNIPAFLRSLDKVISIGDYDPQVIRAPGAGVELAFSEPYVSSFRANHVKVHAWTTEEVQFCAEDTTQAAIESQVTYNRYARLPVDRIGRLRKFLDERTMVTTNNVIVRPGVIDVDLYFPDVVIEPSVEPKEFHRRMANAIVTLFEEGSGFALRVADVYEAVEKLKGVRTFFLDRMVVETLRRGTLKFGSQPSDGDSVKIQSTRNATAVKFEFDSDPDPGSLDDSSAVRVKIGNTLRETLLNAALAIDDNVAVEANVSLNTDVIDIKYAEDVGDIRGTIDVNSGASNNNRINVLSSTADPQARVVEDRRRDQTPLTDQWPPKPGAPVNEPANYSPTDGVSLCDANTSQSGEDYGIKPYREIDDVEARIERARRRYYDNTYLYNNEIFYSSVAGINATVQAVNLRRLVANIRQATRRR